MKAIVTGANGFLGRALTERLAVKGHEVIAIIRNMDQMPQNRNDNIRFVCKDMAHIHELRDEKQLADCDVWFHLAWSATSGNGRADVRLQLNNVSWVCDSVETADALGCRKFVNAGSIMEYEAISCLQANDCTPGLGYIYSTAKLCADFMAKTISASKRIEYMNVIISNIFGAGEVSERFLNSTLRKMMNNERIPLTEGRQMYDFIYISDAVDKIIFVGENGQNNNSYYLGNPVQRPLRDFVLDMARVSGTGSELAFGAVPFHGPYMDYSEFDTAKLENMGCCNKVSFAEGVRKTIEWMGRVQ